MNFDIANLEQSLEMLAQGMIGIFVVLGIIAIFVWGLGKLESKKKKK